MRVPAEAASLYPSRIELIAYCPGAYAGAYDGEDMVSACLQILAAIPFRTESFIGPLHTASLEKPLFPGCAMTAFFFAVPDGVEMSRLCRCTPGAQLVVSVIPISASERACAVEHGSERLIELFDKHKVPNLFDPFRKPVA